jgi:citrate lyase subunit beta/citryl-CoA lyase
MALFRSLLIAPANDSHKAAKTLRVGADVVVLDLEDAVAMAQKAAARAALVEFLDASALISDPPTPVYVRVNALSTPFAFEDFQATVRPRVQGIVLSKTENATQVSIADYLITQLEVRQRMEAGAVDLILLLETASGIANAREIMRASRRVRRVIFGAGDYTLDLNANWSEQESELLYARSALAVESRAAGLEAPIDTPYADFKNIEGFRQEAARGRDLGFQGKLVIHPSQVAPANEIFSPTDADVAWAEKVAAAFDQAEAAGIAAIEVDGRMVDYPSGYRARRIRARVEEIRRKKLPARA